MNRQPYILLAEDDADLGTVMQQYLVMNGFKVSLARDGAEALQQFRKGNFDICILDVMMPGMDGFTLSKKIRMENPVMPFIFLTAKAMKEDRIAGLKLGADDYITKPFDPEELVLRISNILTRAGKGISMVFEIGDFTLDFNTYNLRNTETASILTAKEAMLLKYLIENRNRVVSRKEILLAIWGENDYFLGRSLDVFISRLRKLLSTDRRIKIEALRGIGFSLTYNP
ncbi:MAG: response regulator transcription factor [Bacteroidota bacterium]